ncbi:hypothetical protein DBB29_23405 [Pandoraea cepalis]|uniref:Uncharacterized protein n=1 Tax=Pandoraea cepalis TaxID=2508294 RepID=A0AAW7MT63_9BURK|nr:hypothetical protein [Pandoraea cepalis]MDN4575956.1 hypothetical protein [Pandoraea cepalis]MDN4581058.1 hypothetical protein [Pandoraea cepalis]
MKMRSIICPSQDSVNFLNAWLPPEISASSHFFFPSPLSDAPATARNVLASHPLQALLIRNAHTTNPVLISDLEVYAEERLMLSASKQQFEIEVVSPTLLAMLFETPEIFTAVFGERATNFLHLMGSYDPERAVGEAGTTVADIIARLDDPTLALLRATPTAQRILARIARLDAKPYLRDNDWDAPWTHDLSQPTRAY